MVTIETIEELDYLLINVAGEIDASSSIDLDNELKTATDSSTRILVNLEDLSYISSAGLGVFISYLESWKSRNVALIIYGLQEKVHEVFEILGLQKLMQIAINKQEAVEMLNEA